MKLKLRDIVPSARPVRLAKDTVKMEELTRSVKEQGMIAPIKVRPAGGRYEVVYGHRRVEAARRAGLEEIEALIEEMDDTRALVEALVENIQREDMKPLDTARALRMLMDETGWSQREVERRGIVSQARVSQLLALLDEPEEIQAVLDNPVITERHIRATRTGLDNDTRLQVLGKATKETLTVNQVRQVAASVAATESGARRDFLLRVPYSADTHDPEKTLRRHREYGDHDPQITGPPKPAADREWQRLPQVKEVALITTAWLRDFAEIQEMEEVGKLSPEAQQFISHRLRAFVKTLEDWLDSADTMEEVVAIPDRAAEMHDRNAERRLRHER